MELQTPRCVIRKLDIRDTDSLFAVLSDPLVMRYIEPPFDKQRTAAFIHSAGLSDPPLVYAWTWKATGALIGHIIYHPYDESAYEIGWILSRVFWGKGLATEITRALICHAKTQGVKRLILECDSKQTITKHIARKLGFQPDGSAHGIDRYQLRLEP